MDADNPDGRRAVPQEAVGSVRVLAAVIRRGERYLVARRPTHKRHGGLWEFPGGKVERGESTRGALRRELEEELGVELEWVGRELFAIVDPGSHFRIEFVEVSIRGEPRCLEHETLAWASLAELSEMPLAPSDRSFVALRLR
jgi:8-oxo-dGTP diphosphatase